MDISLHDEQAAYVNDRIDNNVVPESSGTTDVLCYGRYLFVFFSFPSK